MKMSNVKLPLQRLQVDTMIPCPPYACCFSAETLVWTKQGFEQIQYISVGDEVLSRCEKTGEMAYKKVTRCYCKDTAITFSLWFGRDGVREAQIIDTTKDHPFWVEGKGWLLASKLEKGVDQLRLQSGELVRFFGLGVQESEWDVYNLDVEDFHTYFVGIEGVWVHNCNDPEDI